MSKTIENLKSGNYKIVDNQGVSVTRHFIEGLEKEFSDLEAKLEEKEKENELMAKTLKMTKFVEKEIEQDKISFAVEQLEKVKELCKKKFDWWENSEWKGNVYDKFDVSNAYFDIEANIDNQIEQLKEMK